MGDIELIMVTGNNNNKFYKMKDLHDGTFEVNFGRVGASGQTTIYPISVWDKKYNEKVRKGYRDVTELRAETPTNGDDDGFKPIDNADVAQLVKELRQMAQDTVKRNYLISASAVTPQMVDRAQYLLNSMAPVKDVAIFNDRLIELFEVIPRVMGNVPDYLASSRDSFGSIIKREQELLDTMACQVKDDVKPASDTVINDQTILDARGLTITPGKADDILLVKKMLGQSYGMLDQVFCVTNQQTQAKFDEFIKQHPIKTIPLWHGSRNENWWSIINSGLVLRPTNAIINGKMFGHGIYFANSARKSIGYTSVNGSYWAGGTSNVGYLAVFEVAYGKPHDVYDWNSQYGKLNAEELKRLDPKADCLHAHKGPALKNDEIIVYKEQQLTIRYLVRIKG